MRLFAALLLAMLLAAVPASAQVDPRSSLLERSGWDALKSGDAHAAAEAFRGALAGDPKNPRLSLGAGVAAFLERRDGDAKSALERALELDPKMSDARALLSQVLYRMGDTTGAMRMLERAVAEMPADSRLTEM